MIQPFTFECPKSILFGKGTREELPGFIREHGKKVCIFAGQTWFVQSGWRDTFNKLLKDFRVEYISCPQGEPTIESIHELIVNTLAFSPDVIVGIGGGSVLDSAKAVSGLVHAGGNIVDYLEGIGKGISLKKPGIPWIAVPTTSGTGAEVTKNSVIKSYEYKVKKSLRSRFLIADTVIVDPELILELPLSISGSAGMDALVQLLESYVSKKAKPFPRTLVKHAIPVMFAALKGIASDPSDLKARTGAAYGALVSGLALANSGLGAVHGFASALGGLYEIPHGLICAVLLNPVLKANADVIRNDLKDLFNEFITRESIDPVLWLINEVSELLKLYGIKSHLKDYGISHDMIDTIARNSAGSSMSGNPKELTMEQMKGILLEVI